MSVFSDNRFRTLPLNPAARSTILIVDSERLYDLQHSRDGVDILGNQTVSILDASNALLDDPLAAKLKLGNLLIAGNQLVQSPYINENYASIETAADYFSLEKWHLVSTFFSKLGARSVEQLSKKSRRDESKIQVKAKGTYSATSADGNIADSLTQHASAEASLLQTFVGGAADVDSARDFLMRHHLNGDVQLNSILEQAANPNNRLSTYRLEMNMTLEAQRTIEASLAVSVPTALLKMSVSVKQVRKSLESEGRVIEVKF